VADQQATFAGLLRKLRAEAQLTQEELAEVSGVRPRTVSDLERGVATTPQRETVRRLADALRLIGLVRAEFEAAARGRPAPVGATGAGGAAAATRTLPRDVAAFTGREQQLRQLMDAAPGTTGVVGIHAIGGMAGIGKTAFAVHAAHQLADRFPDGQIFLSLYGHTAGQRPVDPGDALASLLLTIGIPAAQIPDGLQARAALWRDRLAGKQLLLVLDDAAGSEQVRPLLPGAGDSLVLITSRRHLSALDDATTISLDTLSVGEATALLARLAGRPGLRADDKEAKEIARLCGYLPLAIGMVARQLHHHPAWTAARRAAELASARDRLRLMVTENLSVAAAFDLSYADLTDDQQRLFRRLGLHPGGEFDAYAATALDGTALDGTALDGTDQAGAPLEALYDHYLLAEPSQGRYRMHDLIREYARALAGREDAADDRDQATARLLDYYQRTATLAEARLARQTRVSSLPALPAAPAAAPVWRDSAGALAWARTERANLLACLDHAASAAGDDARVVALTAAIASLLRQDGPWTTALERHANAVLAARRLGDRAALADALNSLGIVRWLADDRAGAAEALQEALSIFDDLGDRLGQANALDNLGHVRQMVDDRPGATQAQEQALAIYRELGDRLGQANAISNLGIVRGQTGDYAAAVEALEQALAIYREIKDLPGQSSALISLGIVRWRSDDYPGAAQALQEALDISRALVDRVGQSNALTNLGFVWSQTGDYQQAIGALEEALETSRDIGSRLGTSAALTYLARVWRKTGEYQRAAGALGEALGVFQELDDRLGEAVVLTYLGGVQREAGDYEHAAESFAGALGTFREINDQGGVVEVFNENGTLALARGDLDGAEGWHRQALALARDLGSGWDEAHAQAGLARCALGRGRPAEAIAGLQEAHDLFRGIGAAEADEIAAELNAMTPLR
jgi:tetratricopeptide (TPR) repeat protein/transcriptional regulator with XRE-family HTH domain